MDSLINRLPPLREGETFLWWYKDETLWVEFRGYGAYVQRGVSADQAYYARFDFLREEIATALVLLRAAAKLP